MPVLAIRRICSGGSSNSICNNNNGDSWDRQRRDAAVQVVSEWSAPKSLQRRGMGGGWNGRGGV